MSNFSDFAEQQKRLNIDLDHAIAACRIFVSNAVRSRKDDPILGLFPMTDEEEKINAIAAMFGTIIDNLDLSKEQIAEVYYRCYVMALEEIKGEEPCGPGK